MVLRAAILSIGDELILGDKRDANAPWLTRRLAAEGVQTMEQRTVPDDRALIAKAVRELAGRFDVLLITGGLGPTPDDLTRDALGDVLTPGQPLETDQRAVRHLERFFAARRRRMPASNLVQARRPATMRFVANPNGTALGMAGECGDCLIYALPGPPHEMQPMVEDHVLAELAHHRPDVRDPLSSTTVHAYGLGESEAAERLDDLAARDRDPLVGTTVEASIVTARIRTWGGLSAARQRLDETANLVEQRWSPYSFGRDSDTLPAAVGRLLRDAGRRLVTAESCTGGWLGKLIVDVPGSSDYYLGGLITYSDTLKVSALGVPPAVLERCGAVSEAVAREMAQRALAAGDADDALSITGVAGPDGGSLGKPVGAVYIGLARRMGDRVSQDVRYFEFPGDRGAVRDRAVKSALQMLRFAMLGALEEQRLLWETTPPRASSGGEG